MEMASLIKQTIREIVVTINTPATNEETQDSDSSSNIRNKTIKATNQPSMKVPVPIIICSLHYGHPDRDSMLATVGNIWLPKLHWEVVSLAKACAQCQQAGKDIKPILRENK